MSGSQLLEKTIKDTHEFISLVFKFTNAIAREIIDRGIRNNASMLESPELEIFAEFGPKLSGAEYGSQEYAEILDKMNQGLQHHYENNRHHPEHFNNTTIYCTECGEEISIVDRTACPKCKGTSFEVKFLLDNMNIVDLVEMLCNWKAASVQYKGDFVKSIEINQDRFAYSNEYKQIFMNSLDYFYKYNFGYNAINGRNENFYADTIEDMFRKIDASHLLSDEEKYIIKYGFDGEFSSGIYYSTSYSIDNCLTVWWNVNKYIDFLNDDRKRR